MSQLQASSVHRPELWMFLYFAVNLILTIHNKWVLNRLNFNFPWTLTALHVSVSGIGSVIFQKFILQVPNTRISWVIHGKLLLFSILYAVNIAISNVSLSYVSLAFHQLVRSSTPAVTLVMEFVLGTAGRRTPRTYLSLVPVVLGVCLATVDEFADVSFTWTGLVLTLLGVALSSAKGIVTNTMMVGPMKLPPLELIWRMSAPSAAQCILYGWVLGELDGIRVWRSGGPGGASLWSYLKIMENATWAMLLNIISFTANKKTSALAMTVAGNIKQALSIIIAVYFFSTRVSLLNLIGATIALAGGVWYSFESLAQQRSQQTRAPLIQPTWTLQKPSMPDYTPVSQMQSLI